MPRWYASWREGKDRINETPCVESNTEKDEEETGCKTHGHHYKSKWMNT